MRETIHKTSAGGVLIKDNQVLTIKWLSQHTIEFPKGTIDDGETAAETAIREVKEETGYDGEIIDELGNVVYEFDWTDGNHYMKTVTFYLMRLANEDDPVKNLQAGEDFENYWLDINRAEEFLSHDDSKEVFRRALKSLKLVR
jgi:8-oxo-dGTP pyrophosphatase MutT (NUDIX family)